MYVPGISHNHHGIWTVAPPVTLHQAWHVYTVMLIAAHVFTT